MFREHQPVISRWARRSPENLAKTIQFCIVSVREKFYNIPAHMETCAAGGPEVGSVLFGWKTRAYQEAWDEREAIYWNCEDIMKYSPLCALSHDSLFTNNENYLLCYLANLHGLNLAKAGFTCQLAYGVSGCLDSLNANQLNLPARFCANFSQLKTPGGRLRRAVKYNKIINAAGGTAQLWDDWCGHVASRYPSRFPTPDDASAHHLTCLNIN